MATTMEAKTDFGVFVRLYAAILMAFAACVAIVAWAGYPLTAIIVACVFAWSLERTAKKYLDKKYPDDSSDDVTEKEGRTRSI